MSFAAYLSELRGVTRDIPANLVVLSTVGSTNLLARRLLREYLEQGGRPPETVVVAYRQTAGRGRAGRRWASAAGAGLYLSLLVPWVAEERLATLPLVAAVGACRGVNAFLSGRCRIKWPNDLVVEGRKVGGLLLEAVLRGGAGGAVIGVGINHSQGRGELPRRDATSLALERGQPPALGSLARGVVVALREELARTEGAAGVVERYRRLSCHQTGQALACRVAGDRLEGTFQGFDRRGLLRLLTPGGEVRVSAGEIVERR